MSDINYLESTAIGNPDNQEAGSSPPTAQSIPIDYNNGTITQAKLTVTEVSGSFIYYLTADGTNWEIVTNGTTHTFTNTGTDLRWKILGSTGAEISGVEITDYH